MQIKIKVKPKSKAIKIDEITDNYFEIKLKSPPEKGKANDELIDILSNYLKVPKSKIKILKGLTSREKLVQIEE